MKKMIRSFCFCFFLLLIVLAIGKILAPPIGEEWAKQAGMSEIHKYKNSYDVCYLGTSMAVSNVSHQEIYEKYGIAGVSVGTPGQPVFLTEYVLEEVLRYQNPAVIVFDSRGLYYTEEDVADRAKNMEDDTIRPAVEQIRTLSIKRKALEETKDYNEEIDVWEYYSKLYFAHDNWKELTYRNFSEYSDIDCMNGNVALFEMEDGIVNVYDGSDPNAGAAIGEKQEQAFAEMVNICKEADVPFLMVTGYVCHNKAQHQALQGLAEKYNVDYIDINDVAEEIGFDYDAYLNDAWHFNLGGAICWSDYLGGYLKQNYDFSDKRNESAYVRFEEQRDIFKKQKDVFDKKYELLAADTFQKYLSVLENVKDDENLILMYVFDEAATGFNDEDKRLFEKLGLEADLRQEFGASYAVVIQGDSIVEEYASADDVSIEGKVEDVEYLVRSGGCNSCTAGEACALINEKDVSMKKRGINVVVYNLTLSQVVSSTCFDTYLYDNPPQTRVVKKGIIQKMSDINHWEDVQ